MTMKAAVVMGAGQTPRYADFSEPTPAAGESKITVTAAAISQVVRSRASGRHYSSSGQFPLVAGVDGVGRLDDGGRVYFGMPRAPYGSMAERAVAPPSRCLALPDELDDVTAAGIANPGMSSWAAVEERAPPSRRDRPHQRSDGRRGAPRRADRQSPRGQKGH